MGIHLRAVAFQFVFLCALPISALASDVREARKLLLVMGFDIAAKATSQSFLAPPEAGFDAAVTENWLEAAEGKFRAEEIIDAAAAEVAGALTKTEIDQMVVFFSGGLGQKVTRLETTAQDPQRAARVAVETQAYLESLGPDFKPRFALYMEMAESLQMIEGSVAMAMNLSYGLAAGMVASGQTPGDVTDDHILRMLAKQEPLIRAAITKEVYAAMAYTYRDLSDDEVRAYIAFLKTEPAVAVYNAVDRALAQVMRRDIRSLGRHLMERAEGRRI